MKAYLSTLILEATGEKGRKIKRGEERGELLDSIGEKERRRR